MAGGEAMGDWSGDGAAAIGERWVMGGAGEREAVWGGGVSGWRLAGGWWWWGDGEAKPGGGSGWRSGGWVVGGGRYDEWWVGERM